MDNREALEQQLNDLEAQKVTLFDSGNADQVEVSNINEKIKSVQNQLNAIESQEIVEDISSSLERFEVGDTSFTLADLAIDADAADILRRGIQTIGKVQANKFLTELNTQKSVYEAQLNAKQEQIGNLVADRDEFQNTNAQLQLERDDLAEKRDAAARQLLEAQAEIARLNSHVDDLRNEIANGSANVHNVIDITSDADLEAAAQRLKAKKEAEAREKLEAAQAAKIRIYNVQQLDGTGSKFGANRADNDEYITFGWLEKNKYVELSGEEVQRFQQELAAAKQAEVELVPETDKPAELVEQFPLQAPELSDTTVPEHSINGELVTDPTEDAKQTLEDRVAALEAAVFGQARVAA